MAYFLGRDVKVAISTEHGTNSFSNTSGVAAWQGSTGGTGVTDLGGVDIAADTGTLTDITGVDISLGAVDEDVVYMGQRTALKAEIKKDTSVTITRKKSDAFWSDMWSNSYRWGADAADAHGGDTQPGTTHGFRLYVAIKDGSEMITVAGCTFTEYAQTLSADGVTEETLTFMSNINPAVEANEVTTVIGSGTTFPL